MIDFSIFTDQKLFQNICNLKKTAATYTAQSTVRRINAQLNQYVELSEFLGNVVLAGYNLDQTSFSELAKMLPNEDGIVKAFELAPDGVVTDVFPQQGNENAFGINMLTDHERKDDANRAKETGNYTLGGPYKLKQGGTGALLFHPVYKEDSIDNDSFWGFVIMVIDWDKFIDEIGLDRLNEASYCYAFEEDIAMAQKVGMNGFIAKPLDAEKMFTILKQSIVEN